jgi:hypothetical protein
MTSPYDPARKWQVGFKRPGTDSPHWTGRLEAVWEVAFDPISDDYRTDEISAAELFGQWASQVRKRYPDLLIPIDWYINGPDNAKFESAPFQHQRPDSSKENFLSFYDWPVDPTTGERLNWFLVSVVDKGWNRFALQGGSITKGGFIQEHTGWKPSMLQPHVYLPSLEKAIG